MMKQCRKLHLPKTDIVSPLANIIFQRLANIRLSAFGDNMETIALSMVFCMLIPPQNTFALQKDLGASSASLNGSWGSFVEGRTRKMQNLKPFITELFYSRILKYGHRFPSYKEFQRIEVSGT